MPCRKIRYHHRHASPSSSTEPSHLLNIEDIASSLSALLMASTTLPPDQVARIIARWHKVSESQLFVVENMTLAAIPWKTFYAAVCFLCRKLLPSQTMHYMFPLHQSSRK
jgi:hypothetical protein